MYYLSKNEPNETLSFVAFGATMFLREKKHSTNINASGLSQMHKDECIIQRTIVFFFTFIISTIALITAYKAEAINTYCSLNVLPACYSKSSFKDI